MARSSASLSSDGEQRLVALMVAPHFHNFHKHSGVILSAQGQIPIWTICQMLSKSKKYQESNMNKLVLRADQAVY